MQNIILVIHLNKIIFFDHICRTGLAKCHQKSQESSIGQKSVTITNTERPPTQLKNVN